MEEPNNIEQLLKDAKEYVDTKARLTKLQTIDKGSELAGSTVVGILLLLFVTVTFLFSSIALAFYLSERSGSFTLGFLSVAGIYFVFAILIYISRNSLIKKPIIDFIIRKILSDEN